MILEIATLCIVLARSPEPCGVGESVFEHYSANDSLMIHSEGSVEPHIGFSADLESAIARDFSAVPEVRHVLLERADGNLLVWIALDNPVSPVREKVFQKELSLIEGFPEIEFDFNVVPAMNRDARDLATNARVVYSR
jgi:hypothetical protein